MPAGDLVVHDVLAEEAAGYAFRHDVAGGGLDVARDLGLLLAWRGSALVVDRLPAGEAYPRRSGPARLFTLGAGEVGRYRANFRFWFTSCACDPSWYYEDWLIHLRNGETEAGGFRHHTADHDVDHRVHLYGGSRRPARSVFGGPPGRGPVPSGRRPGRLAGRSRTSRAGETAGDYATASRLLRAARTS
jgi:hypothetical protein